MASTKRAGSARGRESTKASGRKQAKSGKAASSRKSASSRGSGGSRKSASARGRSSTSSRRRGRAKQPSTPERLIGAVRSVKRPTADIEEGHKSTLLCHLGNIAYRTGRTLNTNPRNGHIEGDREAMELWSREYRKGWEPKV